MGEGTDGQPTETDGSPSTTQGTPRKKRTTSKKLVPRKKNWEAVIFVTCVFLKLCPVWNLKNMCLVWVVCVTETCVSCMSCKCYWNLKNLCLVWNYYCTGIYEKYVLYVGGKSETWWMTEKWQKSVLYSETTTALKLDEWLRNLIVCSLVVFWVLFWNSMKICSSDLHV